MKLHAPAHTLRRSFALRVAIFTLSPSFPSSDLETSPAVHGVSSRVVRRRSALRTCGPRVCARGPPRARPASALRRGSSPFRMTLILGRCENDAGKMNADVTKQICGKSLRPVRNRRCTRRNFVSGQRPPKRLFTPEIKRYLKDWLVRRRDNPYPNRDEKKFLAHDTGLTYIQDLPPAQFKSKPLPVAKLELKGRIENGIRVSFDHDWRQNQTWDCDWDREQDWYQNREQDSDRDLGFVICNWFANWRRKLKNVHSDKNQKTWGHLIRTYNNQAQGNVEQFSICSDDSIWSEPEPNFTDNEIVDANTDTDIGPDDSPELSPHTSDSTTDRSQMSPSTFRAKYQFFNQLNNNNYNQSITEDNRDEAKGLNNPLLLSKWLESAARFQPSETNYSWWAEGRRRKGDPKGYHHPIVATVTSAPALDAPARHDRDEVEAAVALTALAASTLLHTH
ncbi:hypothetical protein EVAR_68467_1 [Eumeta japonica]|uniref:Homeobox domain-containing protein n=1 Tax=Eumeta variegata TaxID=151549 RepID=A0A4C2AA43_EUMVA|nr:hypothetical protein EVAR_68467_1 [Eumeta japonica]